MHAIQNTMPKKAIACITRQVPALAIYGLTGQIHQYLLVFTQSHVKADTAHLIKEICSRFGHTATILIHKETALRQHPGNQSWFFKHAIENWDLLYSSPDFTIDSSLQKAKRQLSATNQYWERRRTLAAIFLEAADAVMINGAGQAQAAFLHSAVEHLCLGLIRIFLGYRPNRYDLGILIELCQLFTPTEEFFPRQTEEDNRLFALLCTDYETLRYGKPDNTTATDIEILTGRCNAFYSKAIRLANHHLETLTSNTK